MIPTLTPKKENWNSVIAPIRIEPACDRGDLSGRAFAEPDVAVGPGVMKAGLLKLGVTK